MPDQHPTTISPASQDSFAKAVELLHAGKLVAFPTETVYGLGADATNDKAVAAIYAAKGRPQFNPLIVHVPDLEEAKKLVIWNDLAQLLARSFWPGPLTLILPRRPDCPISLLASAGLDTLAVRVPSHPLALKLLKLNQRPIAAPSANAFGKLSPTTAEHVRESLGDNVDLILDGGKTTVGLESTVVDLTTLAPAILRPGGITHEQLEQVLGHIDNAITENAPIKSPGLLTSHYAPLLPIRLNALEAGPDEALLTFGPAVTVKGGALRLNLSETADLCEAAANLFSMLRQLDQPQLTSIAVMPIPDTGLGAAINDRLTRAAAPRS